MRLMKNVILCCLLLAASPLVAHADKLVTQLRVSVDTFAVRRISASTPTRVVFTGAPIRAEVSLVAAALPSANSAAMSISLPSKEWWNDLLWDLERAGKTMHPRPALAANADPSAELRSGQRLVARFNLGELPPGEYRLKVRLGDLHSDAEWFLVSNGQENNDLRREFARYNVDRSRDNASLKRNLLALAAADSLNASPWVRLGDLALADGSAEEIRGYYDRAIGVLDQRRQSFAAEGRADVVTAIQSEREMITAVRELVPQYVANRATMVLHADLEGGKHYVLRERATGRVLRTIGHPVLREER